MHDNYMSFYNITKGPEMVIVFSQIRHLVYHSEDLYNYILNLPILLGSVV